MRRRGNQQKNTVSAVELHIVDAHRYKNTRGGSGHDLYASYHSGHESIHGPSLMAAAYVHRAWAQRASLGVRCIGCGRETLNLREAQQQRRVIDQGESCIFTFIR